MNLTAKQQAFVDAVAESTPEGYTLVCGWPDEENGLTWEDYIQSCLTLIDELDDGQDVGTFPSYSKWKEERRGNDSGLGFSHGDCALCGALPGERYAVTAIPLNPANSGRYDYYALQVCGDCLQYVANGELPED